MNKFINFLKENSQFIYSVILIILIPILIVANTLWQIRSSNATQEAEQEKKALLTEAVLVNSIDVIKQPPAYIQNQIDNIAKENDEIKEITILNTKSDGFAVLASTNQQNLGLTFTSEEYIKAFAQDKPSINIIQDTSKTTNERFLTVSAPIKNSLSAQKTALVNVKISLSDIDTLNRKNYSTTLVFLVVTVFLVLLLLINFARFFEFAVLFKKLNEVDKMKDDFISIATHEMKTPMAAIKGYISMMMEGLVGKFDDKTRDHLLKINTNIQRLDLLLSETLDVSRLEQGRMQFDMQPYDISKVVEQSIKMSLDQAITKGLKLSQEKLERMPMTFIDPDRIQQVVDNLIGNAVKYTQKGSVTVLYKMENGQLRVIVKDTGIGMNEEDRKGLFTKFYRIKNEKTVDIAGTGLGLWIAREIVRKMNGDILVNSKENVGSEFIISLPYMKEKV
ncbi:TPA: sensor histidine kinase [Candidatus Berkelbacteria bacterium]|uniref:histidine kinase n=1 Tax=Berkelbacteria bacterium GW2011_GWE1_39_12 TaxID=1618337 RepID=A0A0G4B5X6_9BACT|nr:MAG: two-component sensor histidine kinase [Berkelbacteria bacterium GW2011_GWE1_39_12]HBO60114.1 sensor histidine kinase [Candidatus Berkelbacteria bacterium]